MPIDPHLSTESLRYLMIFTQSFIICDYTVISGLNIPIWLGGFFTYRASCLLNSLKSKCYLFRLLLHSAFCDWHGMWNLFSEYNVSLSHIFFKDWQPWSHCPCFPSKIVFLCIKPLHNISLWGHLHTRQITSSEYFYPWIYVQVGLYQNWTTYIEFI